MFETNRLSKLILTVLLFSLENLGGVPVQCFAGMHHVGTAARNREGNNNNNSNNHRHNTNVNLYNDRATTRRQNHGGSVGNVGNGSSNMGIVSLTKRQSIRSSSRNTNVNRALPMVSVTSEGDRDNHQVDDQPKNTNQNDEPTNKDIDHQQQQQQHADSSHVPLSIRGGESKSSSDSAVAASIPRAFPCGDALDRKLIKIALPCIANFAINPLVGAVDLFWINRMGSTLAVAGQAAANQIFSSAFWLTSFLPAVTATLVAKEKARGDEEGVQDAVCQALIVGTMIAIVGMGVVLSAPDSLLSGVLSSDAPARQFARPYLMIRGLGFLPSMYTLIGFSSFRGVQDTVTPLQISLFSNVLNAVWDPILIFTAGMGVTGAALATLGSELSSAILFITLLFKRRMISTKKLFRVPSLKNLEPLLKGGAALQLRNFALNLTFLAVTRVTQSIDETGVAAAAHAMAIQTFQIGGIVLLALSTVAQFLVPGEMVEKVNEETGEVTGGPMAAKAVVNRLMSWGFVLGTALGALQVVLLPNLLKGTPIQEVRQAARIPAILGSFYQCFNGLVFIGEGVMVGTGSFLQLSISTLVATIGTLIALETLPAKFGLTGVWMGFGVFNTLRLAGVAIHQLYNGPLSKRMIARNQNKEAAISGNK